MSEKLLVRWDIDNNAEAAATGGHRMFDNGVRFVINWRYYTTRGLV